MSDDDLLCHVVARSSLCSKDICLWYKISVWISLEVIVLCNDVQSVELLSLVFVKSFYLNVKDRVSVENNAVLILYILCKTLLVVKLDLCKSVKNVLVVLEYSKLRKLSGILEEAVAYLLAKKICQTLVRLIKPSSVCDTVCNVLDLISRRRN